MKRLTDHQIGELASIDSPTISNAIEHFELRHPTEGYMGPEIRCLLPELGAMVGYVVTATADTTTPNKRQELQIPELLQAIEDSYGPVVLVVKSEGTRPARTCVIGEMISTMMKRIGAIGVVTDGCVRDVQQIRKLGFHLFATGTVVSHGIPSLAKINEPVEVSGVRLEPGDLVHGDENGLQKVPWECVNSLADKAMKILADEGRIIEGVKAAELPPDVKAFFYGEKHE